MVVRVVVVMPVVMIMLVIMPVVTIMVVFAMRMSERGRLQQPVGFLGFEQLRHRHFLLGGLGLRHDQVDDLVLENRRAKLDEGVRIFLIVVVDNPLLTGITAGPLHPGGAAFILGA